MVDSNNKQIRKVEKGKFYLIHDGSKTGHPCYVITADDVNNRYLVVRFDSDKFGAVTKEERGMKHITKLKYPISDNIENSYVKNRPMICKRKDIGSKELIGMVINKEDRATIEKVSNNNPQLSLSLKK